MDIFGTLTRLFIAGKVTALMSIIMWKGEKPNSQFHICNEGCVPLYRSANAILRAARINGLEGLRVPFMCVFSILIVLSAINTHLKNRILF